MKCTWCKTTENVRQYGSLCGYIPFCNVCADVRERDKGKEIKQRVKIGKKREKR